MLKRYYQVVGSVLLLADGFGLVCSWLLAYYLRFYTEIVPVTKGIPPFDRYVSLLVPVVFIWAAVFAYFRLYRSSRIMRRTTELGAVLRAHGAALAVFVALTFVFSEYRFSRVVIGYFGVLSISYLLLVRWGLRNFIRYLGASGSQKRNLVIVGAGATALAFLDRARRMPELGVVVKGFFTADGRPHASLPAPVLGSYDDVARVTASRKDMEEIVLALPRADADAQDKVLKSLSDTLLTVHLVPDVAEYVTLGCSVESFDELPVMALNESPLTAWGSFWKRVLDLLGASFALFVFSPLYLAIAIAVKLTSRGPIFYGQERMSLSGGTFKMWKFRSMKVDAEKETGAVWAKKDDDRKTPIGSFLRATSLDEIPQFWNVLVGEMSLVGPRPERPQFVHQFRHNVPRYMLRHKMKAGITGWAQVNGWRGDTSLEKRIECDLYYIRNWSLFFDIKILFFTLFKGFVNKNAY